MTFAAGNLDECPYRLTLLHSDALLPPSGREHLLSKIHAKRVSLFDDRRHQQHTTLGRDPCILKAALVYDLGG